MDRNPCSILIPAAGNSVRFREAGWTKPKGLIRLRWAHMSMPMIVHCMSGSVLNNAHGSDIFSRPRVVCKKEDAAAFRKELESLQAVFGIEDSIGQAETCALGVENMTGEVLIINCDNVFDGTILMDFVTTCRTVDSIGGAVVFPSLRHNLRYGYVDNAPWFHIGIEKHPISSWALAGAFYFRDAQDVARAYDKLVKKRKIMATYGRELEPYLSQLFEFIPGPKLAYRIGVEDFHEWGTPELLMDDPEVTVLDKPKKLKRKRGGK